MSGAVSDEELLARFQASTNRPPCSELTDFQILRIDQANNSVEVSYAAKPAFCNPMGQIQGGYLCVMLDDTMSVAGLVTSGMTHVMPTLEMKTSFLRPALPNQRLRCVGRVLKWGKTIAFTEGALYDAQDRLIATATATAMPQPFSRFTASA